MKKYTDLMGDGGSGIVDQIQEQRRRISENLSGFKAIVAIGSGKGGVGKSTLTSMIGLSLHSTGIKTVVLDADFNGPSQARLLGSGEWQPAVGERGMLVPKNKDGLGVISFGALVQEPEMIDFPSVASGDSFTWRATREFSVLADFLARCEWQDFDMLLLDLPPGSERTFQYAEFLGQKVRFLLVTLPSSVSKGVVRRSHTALKRAQAEILGYVENMSGYYCQDCEAVKPLFPTTSIQDDRFPCLGKVPFDPRLAELCDQGLTLQDLSALSVWGTINEIGHRLVRKCRPPGLEVEVG